MFDESEVLELKREITEDLKKEIIAFANADGGSILIGVEDDGTIVGLSDVDNEMNRITSMIRDAIKPDLTMFVKTKAENYEDKRIVRIEIQRGEKKPYYIASKGMKPTGVYIRQGHSIAPVSEEQIRKMIREADGVSYEQLRSLNQELTFEFCKKEFYNRKVPFEDAQMKTLGLIRNDDNMYSNSGMLLSDQGTHSIKAAVFQGEAKAVFRDRKEFTGSILKQLEEVYQYIDMYNRTHAEIKGLYREDKRDYPEVAIRETLLNAIIHREYALSGSTLISIFDDRIEFVSLGGLVSGITVDDISYGISLTRNEKIANIFYRLELVEAYGTGISKVYKSYELEKRKPVIEVSDNVFKVTLFNRNVDALNDDLTSDQKAVLNLVKQKEKITRRDVESLLEVSQTMAGRILKQLVEMNVLVKRGKASNTVYVLLVK
jgi:ATP-dependent DNA helicase RecG